MPTLDVVFFTMRLDSLAKMSGIVRLRAILNPHLDENDPVILEESDFSGDFSGSGESHEILTDQNSTKSEEKEGYNVDVSVNCHSTISIWCILV